jgi:hypothetical protein
MPITRKQRTPISDKRLTLLAKKSGIGALKEVLMVEKTIRGVAGEARANASIDSFLKHQSEAQKVIMTKTLSVIIAQRILRRAQVPINKRAKIFEAVKRLSDAKSRGWEETVTKRKENLLSVLEETLGEEKALAFFKEYEKNFEHNFEKISDALSQNTSP